jgi:hypothetical protein
MTKRAQTKRRRTKQVGGVLTIRKSSDFDTYNTNGEIDVDKIPKRGRFSARDRNRDSWRLLFNTGFGIASNTRHKIIEGTLETLPYYIDEIKKLLDEKRDDGFYSVEFFEDVGKPKLNTYLTQTHIPDDDDDELVFVQREKFKKSVAQRHRIRQFTHPEREIIEGEARYVESTDENDTSRGGRKTRNNKRNKRKSRKRN